LYLTPEFLGKIKTEDVLYVAPRIKFGVLLGQGEMNTPSLGYAIDTDIEKNFSGLDKRIVQGSYFTGIENATIIGKELAKQMNLKIGDTLTIITRTAYDSPTGINLIVQGIFSVGIGGMDKNIFYIPLKTGQRLLDLEDRATEVALILKDAKKSLEVAKSLQSESDLSVVPYQYNSILKYFNSATIMFSLIYFIILIVACSTIANTMIMIVYERTREIGMLKAMGMTNSAIIRLLVLEAGIIGLVGSLIGTVMGSVLSFWMKYQGFDISKVSASASADMPFGPIIYFAPTSVIIITAFLFGLLASMIVALIPVSRAAKLEPAKALKTIT